MAEEKTETWQKWEGPGNPPGPGGTTSPEKSDAADVEGRGKKGDVIVCWNCGVGHYLEPTWKWFTCWRCGAVNFANES